MMTEPQAAAPRWKWDNTVDRFVRGDEPLTLSYLNNLQAQLTAAEAELAEYRSLGAETGRELIERVEWRSAGAFYSADVGRDVYGITAMTEEEERQAKYDDESVPLVAIFFVEVDRDAALTAQADAGALQSQLTAAEALAERYRARAELADKYRHIRTLIHAANIDAEYDALQQPKAGA